MAKKKNEVDIKYKGVLDQFYKIVQRQYSLGKSKFIISFTTDQYFMLVRELNAQQRYLGLDDIDGMLLSTVAGTPVIIDRNISALRPQSNYLFEVVSYTDEIMTFQEALEEAHKKKFEIGKIKEL